jgi:hypothetical protein
LKYSALTQCGTGDLANALGLADKKAEKKRVESVKKDDVKKDDVKKDDVKKDNVKKDDSYKLGEDAMDARAELGDAGLPNIAAAVAAAAKAVKAKLSSGGGGSGAGAKPKPTSKPEPTKTPTKKCVTETCVKRDRYENFKRKEEYCKNKLKQEVAAKKFATKLAFNEKQKKLEKKSSGVQVDLGVKTKPPGYKNSAECAPAGSLVCPPTRTVCSARPANACIYVSAGEVTDGFRAIRTEAQEKKKHVSKETSEKIAMLKAALDPVATKAKGLAVITNRCLAEMQILIPSPRSPLPSQGHIPRLPALPFREERKVPDHASREQGERGRANRPLRIAKGEVPRRA